MVSISINYPCENNKKNIWYIGYHYSLLWSLYHLFIVMVRSMLRKIRLVCTFDTSARLGCKIDASWAPEKISRFACKMEIVIVITWVQFANDWIFFRKLPGYFIDKTACSGKMTFIRSMFMTRLQSLHQLLKDDTPKGKWLLLFKFTDYMCNLIGSRFVTDGAIHWVAYVSGVLFGVYLVLTPYSLIYNILVGRLGDGLKACCSSGLIISVNIGY